MVVSTLMGCLFGGCCRFVKWFIYICMEDEGMCCKMVRSSVHGRWKCEVDCGLGHDVG